MKILQAMFIATVPLLATRVAYGQSGNMMDGGMWGVGSMGGYGGIWVPILVVVLVAGVVAWVVKQRGK
jgi:hypothetical protein